MHERRDGADVLAEGADRDQMAGDAVQLAGDHAAELAAPRHLDAAQFLRRQAKALVGEHRREIVDAVGVGHDSHGR